MADNSLTEIMVERLFRARDYLVERNIPLAPSEGPQFESDLDVLAVREDVVLVNCKDFVNSPKQIKRICENLQRAEAVIKKRYAPVLSGKKITRLLVYETACNRRMVQTLQGQGRVCKTLREVFVEYLQAIEKYMEDLPCEVRAPRGRRWFRTGNLKGYEKVFQYLLDRCLIQPDTFHVLTGQQHGITHQK